MIKNNLRSLYDQKDQNGAFIFRTLFTNLILLAFIPPELVVDTQRNLFKKYTDLQIGSDYASDI